jgi:ABC-type multidrug transport system fused ATPase/permease subunit
MKMACGTMRGPEDSGPHDPLEPLIAERPAAYPLTQTREAPGVEVTGVWFRYPEADQVSLASLEPVALPAPQRPGDAWVLRDVTFQVPAVRLTALVGPSGAGKTTITHLVPRLYDPVRGAVRIGGHDVRDLTLESLRQWSESCRRTRTCSMTRSGPTCCTRGHRRPKMS